MNTKGKHRIRNKVFLMLVSFLTMYTSAMGMLIAKWLITDLAKEAPLILLAEVIRVDDFAGPDEVFGFEKLPERQGGKTRTATVEIDSIIKGKVSGTAVPVLFFQGSAGEPFTNLEVGRAYVLFVSETRHGLRLFDPSNGGLAVAEGPKLLPNSTPVEQVTHCIGESLKSSDHAILLTAILALGELGAREHLPKLRAFLSYPNEEIRAAAIGTCLRLGDEHLVGEAVRIYEKQEREQGSALGFEHTGFVSLSAMNTLTEGLSVVKGSNSTPAILDLLRTASRKSTKLLLLESLRHNARQEAVPFLLHLANGEDDDISYEAYRALAGIRGSCPVAGHAFTEKRKASEIAAIEDWWKTLKAGGGVHP